jgi:hypothetical protein
MEPVSLFLIQLSVCFGIELDLEIRFIYSEYSKHAIKLLNKFDFEKNENNNQVYHHVTKKQCKKIILSMDGSINNTNNTNNSNNENNENNENNKNYDNEFNENFFNKYNMNE